MVHSSVLRQPAAAPRTQAGRVPRTVSGTAAPASRALDFGWRSVQDSDLGQLRLVDEIKDHFKNEFLTPKILNNRWRFWSECDIALMPNIERDRFWAWHHHFWSTTRKTCCIEVYPGRMPLLAPQTATCAAHHVPIEDIGDVFWWPGNCLLSGHEYDLLTDDEGHGPQEQIYW